MSSFDSIKQIKQDLIRSVKQIKNSQNKPVKAILLNKDIPSNYNRTTNTLYVNPKEVSMKDKLTSLVTHVEKQYKVNSYKPKLIPHKDYELVQQFLKANPEYKAVYGSKGAVLSRGTNKLIYIIDGKKYVEKVDLDYTYSDLKVKADLGPDYYF